MQKYRISLTIISLIILLCSSPSVYASPQINVSANNAILIDQDTGNVLFEKEADEIQEIASITKVMTAIIALESNQLKENVVTSRRAINTEGSAIYLEQGEKMALNDLTYGLMLRSGNDAAVAISEHIGGSVEGFVHLMNEKAKWLGMTNTHFSNPHGLPDENHYSTAFDMGLLMRYAMTNEKFKKVSGTESYQADTRSYAWKNKNKLLTMYDDRCTGGKTGFTRSSGRTLITTASEDGVNLTVVTLNAPDDWQDHMALYNYGFSQSDKTDNEATKTYRSNEPANGYYRQFLSIFKRVIGLIDNG